MRWLSLLTVVLVPSVSLADSLEDQAIAKAKAAVAVELAVISMKHSVPSGPLVPPKTTPIIPVTPVIPKAIPADYHSHTCVNGHTWWHSASDPTASHHCPVCGSTQYTIDPGSMGKAPVTTSIPNTTNTQTQVYTLSGTVSGGCANGSCSAPTRGGLFPRLRGGR